MNIEVTGNWDESAHRTTELEMPKLDHVAIQVSDLLAAIAFYTEKLGLKLLYTKVDESHGESFAFLEMEGGNLELLQLLDETGAQTEKSPSTSFAPPAIRKPYCPHLAIESTDLEPLVEELKCKEIPIVTGPLEIPGSVRWLYIRDPDNNIIEYIQYL
ncbi:MAG: VOC family protein [Aeoliella sp.]